MRRTPTGRAARQTLRAKACRRCENLVYTMAEKTKTVTLSATQRRQAGDGIFSAKANSHGGLNTLARGVQKAANGVRAGLLAFASSLCSDDLHSGATARDSHPLPYSPRSTRDTQTHLKELERDAPANASQVNTRASRSQKCSSEVECANLISTSLQ